MSFLFFCGDDDGVDEGDARALFELPIVSDISSSGSGLGIISRATALLPLRVAGIAILVNDLNDLCLSRAGDFVVVRRWKTKNKLSDRWLCPHSPCLRSSGVYFLFDPSTNDDLVFSEALFCSHFYGTLDPAIR